MRSPDPLLPAEKRKISLLAQTLLGWMNTSGRDFPWRSPDATIYEKIVVEVLLQRTNAAAVSKLYERFFSRFGSWTELSAAHVSELEDFLRPLGLWRRRAISLIGLARYAVASDGNFPPDPSMHAQIPAVGQYVSNAIMLFQHEVPAPLLDVNMARVIERLLRPRLLVDIRNDPWLQEAASWYVKGNAAIYRNWAILDFAALVCKSRAPLCSSCPVSSICAYFSSKGNYGNSLLARS